MRMGEKALHSHKTFVRRNERKVLVGNAKVGPNRRSFMRGQTPELSKGHKETNFDFLVF